MLMGLQFHHVSMLLMLLLLLLMRVMMVSMLVLVLLLILNHLSVFLLEGTGLRLLLLLL
jgi:hypothetical protein